MDAPQFHIRGIPANTVERFWPFAEPYVKRALDHTSGEFTPLDVKRLCKDRVVQLWLVSENGRVIAAATTEIVIYPQCKHCRIATIGGSRGSEWTAQLFEVLESWAKTQGCTSMEAFTRRGYVPVLTGKHGYKSKYACLVKEL